MPPIAPSPQGSRAGLITSLVIFVILFVTATLFAIYFGSQWQAAEMKGKKDVAVLTPYVAPADLNDKNVIELTTATPPEKAPTAIVTAINQRNEALKLIDGNPAAGLDAAKGDVARALNDVRNDLKTANATVSVTDENLLTDLKNLSSQIVALSQAVARSEAETKAASEATAASTKAREAALADKDKQIEAVTKAAADTKALLDTVQKKVDDAAASLTKSSNDAIAAAQQQTKVTSDELTKVQGDLKKSLEMVKRLQHQLALYRLDTTKPLLRPAGEITRVPGNGTVFINIGQGDSVSPGLTFEIYDKNKGLPPLSAGQSANTEALPAGKASIEVIRVLPGTSECRIIHTTPGYQIIEGDLILNLVYNTHTHFTFVVYGDFDLANTGQTNAGDVDVMRRLVTQWGGRLSDQVNVDTDFLVLGKEPVVPPLPDNPTPIDQEHHDKAVKALDNYQTILTQGINLTVPVLNQNRFLYFVGYYDQAKR